MKTSATHPLKIAEVPAALLGVIGITLCPGKHQAGAATGSWARDLDIDLDAVLSWGASIVLTLVTDAELKDLKVSAIGRKAEALGMEWLHLPIEDGDIPTEEWEARWRLEGTGVHKYLDAGARVLVHCKGGLGRAGLVSALLLVERGVPADEANLRVREARPGAIETQAQEDYVRTRRGGITSDRR